MLKAFGQSVRETENGLLLESGGIRIRFGLQVGDPIRIGALQLATFRVDIDIVEGDPERASALLARADQATQRGGG